MTTDRPTKETKVLWQPTPELWEDDYTKPPTLQFKLCNICRKIMASPSAIERLQAKSGVRLCRGSSQETQCSLRAMILKCSAFQIEHEECAFVKAASGPDGRHKLDMHYLEIFTKSASVTAKALVQVHAYCDDPAAQHISSRPYLENFISYEAFHRIGEFIQGCEQSHLYCSVGLTPVTLPTRVIDIQYLRVHCTVPGEVGQYAALSYCWGVERISGSLVRDNLDMLTKDICANNLPQTVKDAISVVEKLGLRYIWVDAYCIIQDSVEDKNKELAHMGEIYARAYITLSAASAASVEDGFLELRRLPPFWSDWGCRLEGWDPIRPSTSFRAFPRLTVDYCDMGTVVLGTRIDWSCPTEPIEQRAWTFQEKQLSPRLLTFGLGNLRWQCDGREQIVGSCFHNLARSGRPACLKLLRNSDSKKPVEMWRQVVEEYSGRLLGHEEDKLIALAAVASRFRHAAGKCIDYAYLAGLWRPSTPRLDHEFIQQLCWAAYPTKLQDGTWKLAPRPSRYIAPTWSWASNKNQVRCSSNIISCTLEVLSCHTTPRTIELPLGGVKNGYLRVRSRLAPAQVVLPNVVPFLPPGYGRNCQSHIVLPRVCHTEKADEDWIGTAWYIMWDAHETHPLNVFCLRLCTDSPDQEGLVLVPDGRDTFRRVGFLYASASENHQGTFREAVNKLYADQELRDFVIV